MKLIYTHQVLNRLEQIVAEIVDANWLAYCDRLRAFKRYCDTTPALANCLERLPHVSYDFGLRWQELPHKWPDGQAGYAYRWDAIRQLVDQRSGGLDPFEQQVASKRPSDAHALFTEMFVIPLYHYLVHQLETSSATLYLLLRYKRWAEWFEAERLRKVYREVEEGGEAALDGDLRRFLFESGVDYPYSQPHSPGGRVDVVAGLDTEDPLVLEIKVWDSEKEYRKNRVRDGLRQVMEYAAQYGKDTGYVAVFNLDTSPLVFVGEASTEWPARLEHGGATYYFIAIDIAHHKEPISQREKGKPVKVNQVQLTELWHTLDEG